MRTLIAVRETPVRDALSGVLSSVRPATAATAATDYHEAMDQVRTRPWDLVALDLKLPGLTGLSGVIALINAAPGAAIMVVGDRHSSEIHRLCRVCGVQGLLDRDAAADDMERVVAMVLRGGLAFPDTLAVPSRTVAPPPPALTGKQLQVLAELAEGKSNKQIAKDLDLSPNTVKAHVSEVLRRLGVTSRAEAIVVTRNPLNKFQMA